MQEGLQVRQFHLDGVGQFLVEEAFLTSPAAQDVHVFHILEHQLAELREQLLLLWEEATEVGHRPQMVRFEAIAGDASGDEAQVVGDGGLVPAFFSQVADQGAEFGTTETADHAGLIGQQFAHHGIRPLLSAHLSEVIAEAEPAAFREELHIAVAGLVEVLERLGGWKHVKWNSRDGWSHRYT